ncbi:hypothetical protein FNF28_03492 [Cafeteria roenbergensis]|uniref:Coronin n=1 Tax=Cafeteria roenbergensis TaxID=33653 RepID=A0A5A8DMX5_CAFRO|nr:hypothetical protein FNF28_03492 [Cafeteria roenbergensis]
MSRIVRQSKYRTDATIKLWEIPDGGLTEKMTEPLATMHGHGKDVTLLQWHPTASNVLASAARDMTVRIWDVENCTDKITIEGCFGGLISDIRWLGATSIYPVSETKSAESTKGLAMLPKRTVDVGRCETARFIKLLRDKAHLVSFTVPRKSDRFQDDIYPDTLAPEPSTTAEGWFGGATPEPKRMSMDPAKNGGATHASVSTTIRSAGKSAADVASAAAASSGAGGAAAAAGASSGASSGAAASSGEVTSLKAQVASLQAALDRAVAAKDARRPRPRRPGRCQDAGGAAPAAKEAAAVGPAAAAADGTIPESADEDVVAELAAVKEENETLKHQVAKLKKTVATLMDE